MTIFKTETCPMCGHTKRKEITISEKRIDNIILAYPEINWDKTSCKITIKGYGDKPSFTMDGYLDRYNVTYHTNTPGGGYSRMYIWINGKKHVVTYASFNRAKEVIQELKIKIKELAR